MESTKVTTQQLMFSLIEIWQGGNKSQQEFCKEKDIEYHKFSYWFRKYRAVHSPTGTDTKFFKQIKLKEQSDSQFILANPRCRNTFVIKQEELCEGRLSSTVP